MPFSKIGDLGVDIVGSVTAREQLAVKKIRRPGAGVKVHTPGAKNARGSVRDGMGHVDLGTQSVSRLFFSLFRSGFSPSGPGLAGLGFFLSFASCPCPCPCFSPTSGRCQPRTHTLPTPIRSVLGLPTTLTRLIGLRWEIGTGQAGDRYQGRDG